VSTSPLPLSPAPFKALGLEVLGVISIRISATALALIIGDKGGFFFAILDTAGNSEKRQMIEFSKASNPPTTNNSQYVCYISTCCSGADEVIEMLWWLVNTILAAVESC